MNRSPFAILSVFLTLLAATSVGYGQLVADAGEDQRAYHANVPVVLDGSGSTFVDPSGMRQFEWTQVVGPDIQLSDRAVCQPFFVPPAEDVYEFQLVVSDGQQTSTPDTVQIVVGSIPTRASARVWAVSEGGNGHAYFPVAVGRLIPWTQADGAATNAGGYLATITSPEESDFVYDMISTSNANLFVHMMGNYYGPWLGGYQLPGSGEPGDGWAWVTGEPFAYTAWNVGEPSNTAGGLNEDRLHYLGHGGPEPLWNDQINADAFGPTAFVVEYDPTVCEAEDATVISNGAVSDTWKGYSGTGYVTLDGLAGNAIQWVTHLGMAGPKTILLRYAHDSAEDVPAQVVVNGIPVKIALPGTGIGAWQAWESVRVDVYFHSGNNIVEVIPLADGTVVSIDKLTMFNNSTNLVFDRRITVSAENGQHPAAHAIDGDLWTYWQVEDLPQWLEVDLGDVYDVHAIQLAGMYGQTCQYYVETKTHPGDAYILIADRTEDTAASEVVTDTFEPVPGRYVRLTVTGGAGVAEFCVSAAAAPASVAIGTVGYRTIQSAIDAAREGDVITVQPGVYTGPGNQALDMRGKRVTLASSDPNDPDVAARTVIGGTVDAPVVRFSNDEDAHCVITGLTLTGGQIGAYVEAASPTISHCRVEGNIGPGLELHRGSQPRIQNCIIAGNRDSGIAMHVFIGRFLLYNQPLITNCTIVENLGYGIEGGRPTVINSILYFNGAQHGGIQIDSAEPVVTYCDVQGGFSGEGNLETDPCFVRLGIWVDSDAPDTTVDSAELDAIWIRGDYHLQSEGGRWDTEGGVWTIDAQTSPCIDAGDPTTPTGHEPDGGGTRINLGAYGGMSQASVACCAADR